MTFARRSALRAAANRRIQFEGEYSTTTDHINLAVKEVLQMKVVKSKIPGEDEMYGAGTILEILASTKVSAHDATLSIKYPHCFYDYGTVSGPSLIDSGDGLTQVKCIISLVKDMPIALASAAVFKIYVEGGI